MGYSTLREGTYRRYGPRCLLGEAVQSLEREVSEIDVILDEKCLRLWLYLSCLSHTALQHPADHMSCDEQSSLMYIHVALAIKCLVSVVVSLTIDAGSNSLQTDHVFLYV